MNKLLKRRGVIPLNSPPYYSKYNGSIEQSNCWIKHQLREVAEKTNCPINDDTVLALARLAAHEENIKSRRVLRYSRAVTEFWLGAKLHDKEKRTERRILRQLIEERERRLLETEIKESTEKTVITETRKRTIKRKAVEEILAERCYIEIKEPELEV